MNKNTVDANTNGATDQINDFVSIGPLLSRKSEKVVDSLYCLKNDKEQINWLDYRQNKIPGDFAKYQESFPSYVTSKIDEKILKENKKEELVTYSLLQWSLGKYFGKQLSEISIDIQGKPYFKNQPNIHFNVSHSNGFSACAISMTNSVGVDIQTIVDYTHGFDFVLNRNEINLVCKESLKRKKDELFTIIWASKEAYLKCLGSGIGNEMKSIDFSNIIKGSLILNNITVCIRKFTDYILAYACEI